MNDSEINQHIAICIESLCADFINYPNRLLTEDDMRMHLGALLLNLECFCTLKETNDGDLSIALHSEVRWYGKGKLKYRSDLVIIDVGSLTVQRTTGLQLPSKGYSFNVPNTIIELKFRRPTGGSDREFLNSIEADCTKLKTIQSELSEVTTSIGCFVIVFDKKTDISLKIPPCDDVKIFYRYSTARKL